MKFRRFYKSLNILKPQYQLYLKKLISFVLMRNYNYVRKNVYIYSSDTIKEKIEKNEFVKNVRAKLMKEKYKANFS